MSIAPVYSLASHVICRRSQSQMMSIVDEGRGVLYELNEPASAIVEALRTGPKSSLELCHRIENMFEGNGPDMEADLGDFLADFERVGLIARVAVQSA